MAPPIPLREFKKLVARYGCRIEQLAKSSHYKIVDEDGVVISGFPIKHGKNTKGNEVKPVYVKQFLDAINETRGN